MPVFALDKLPVELQLLVCCAAENMLLEADFSRYFVSLIL